MPCQGLETADCMIHAHWGDGDGIMGEGRVLPYKVEDGCSSLDVMSGHPGKEVLGYQSWSKLDLGQEMPT